MLPHLSETRDENIQNYYSAWRRKPWYELFIRGIRIIDFQKILSGDSPKVCCLF